MILKMNLLKMILEQQKEVNYQMQEFGALDFLAKILVLQEEKRDLKGKDQVCSLRLSDFYKKELKTKNVT